MNKFQKLIARMFRIRIPDVYMLVRKGNRVYGFEKQGKGFDVFRGSTIHEGLEIHLGKDGKLVCNLSEGIQPTLITFNSYSEE